MSLIEAFFDKEAIIRPYLRYGGGAPVYGEPQVRACRLEPAPNVKIVYKNASGSIVETVASALMFCTGEEIPVNSECTVGGRTMRVIKCPVMSGFAQHHLEVYLE